MKAPARTTATTSSSSAFVVALVVLFQIVAPDILGVHSFVPPSTMRRLTGIYYRTKIVEPIDPGSNVCLTPDGRTTTNTEVSVTKAEDPEVALTEVEIELLVRNLKKNVDIPHIPAFLEPMVLETAMTTVCKIAPLALPENMFHELVAGKVKWAKVKKEVIHKLNEEICIPIISRETQDELIKGICLVLFGLDNKAARRKMIGRTLQKTFNNDSLDDFATMLNEMIDVPFVSEEDEQVVALKLAKSIHSAFETLVPEGMRELLAQNSSPEELQEARLNLIKRLNEMIDIPLMSEMEEEKAFAKIVDKLLERYGLAEGTKQPSEELADIARELSILEEELDIQEALFEQKTKELNTKKLTLLDREKILLAEMIPAEKNNSDDNIVLPYFAEC